MNIPTIEGTLVHKYLKIAVSEASPQIYKPRSGKVNCNYDKFNRIQLDFIIEYSYKFLRMFGYYDTCLENGATPVEDIVKEEMEYQNPNIDDFISNFNREQLAMSIKQLNEADEFTSIYINYPALLLRKKSEMYPHGRTSHRFKHFLRRRVTIVGKDKKKEDPSTVKDVTELDEAEQEIND